jgi:hypothetical protein
MANQPYQFFEEAIFKVLIASLLSVSENYKSLLSELNKLFDSQEYVTFMDPAKFVHNLYDDASFSRSRFYFWAIGCLSVFEENIIANRRNITAFQREYIPEVKGRWDSVSAKESEYFRGIDQRLKEMSRDMEEVRVQLAGKLEDIRALRDGVSDKH